MRGAAERAASDRRRRVAERDHAWPDLARVELQDGAYLLDEPRLVALAARAGVPELAELLK